MPASVQPRLGADADAAPMAQALPPLPVHLVYLGAIDLRICLLAAAQGADLRPVSKIDAFLDGRTQGDGLVLLDGGNAPARALAVLRRIVAHGKGASIAVLCEQGSAEFFRQCFRAGALDVLDKSHDDERIAEALGQALAAARSPGPRAGLRQARTDRFARLSEREKEVFTCLLAGHTSREIAALLGLSSRTVELHRVHLRDKLQVRNCAQMAWDYGFLSAG